MSDPGLILVADVHGLVGRHGELRPLLAELAAAARSEPGCVSFRVLSADEPGEHVVLAVWRDEPALRAHYDTAAYRRYSQGVGPLLARPSDVVLYHLGATVHARDPNPPEPGMLG